MAGDLHHPDEIEKGIRRDGFLSLADFSVATTGETLFAFLNASQLLAKAKLLDQVDLLALQGQRVVFGPVAVNSYWASVLADFMRHQLLAAGVSFTFETVMSSPDKVDFLCKARAQGFRTYLYYVATEDPAINIERVRQRVATGGHELEMKSEYMPEWFKTALWNRFEDVESSNPGPEHAG